MVGADTTLKSISTLVGCLPDAEHLDMKGQLYLGLPGACSLLKDLELSLNSLACGSVSDTCWEH